MGAGLAAELDEAAAAVVSAGVRTGAGGGVDNGAAAGLTPPLVADGPGSEAGGPEARAVCDAGGGSGTASRGCGGDASAMVPTC